MIIEKIETLKAELDELVGNGATFAEIYEKSQQIDACLLEYYKG